MKRNKNWLENKNATKNAKVFSVKMFRDASGDLHLVGNETTVLDRRTNEWVPVNTRDFARLINLRGVNSL